jgi:hypothetical protein
MPLASLIFLVCATIQASGVDASEPYASAVQTESQPIDSASWIAAIGTSIVRPEYPMVIPSFIDGSSSASRSL